MSKIDIYNGKLKIDLPDGFEQMNDEENKKFFSEHKLNYSYILREKNTVVGIVVNDVPLNNETVEKRINQYYALYSRMAPGFVMGEMKMKQSEENTFGILSFKSNAPERDLFNIVLVANFNGKELFIIATGNMQDAESLIPKYVKMIDQMVICK